MILKELAKSKLEMDGSKAVIKKEEGFELKIQKGNVLDFETDGTAVIKKKRTVSLRERLEQETSGKINSEGMDGTEELSMDAKTDIFDLDGKSLEVAAAKVLNQVVNDQEYDDQIYFLTKLTIGVTRTEDSLLELFSPDMMKESELLKKREKATYDEKLKLVVKRISPFRYEFSTVIPSEYGSAALHDQTGLNNMITYIDQMLANIMEYNYISEDIKVSKDILAKHSIAMGNKSRIKNYITGILRKAQGEEVSQIDINDQANQVIEEIWETLGVKPLTDKRLDVELQIMKIHRSSNPEEFTTKRRNVTIMKDDTGSIKIERLRYSIDKSVPYLTSQEKTISGYLSDLVGYFTVWAENEARHSLDLEDLNNPYSLKKLYPENKKVLSVLGYSEEEAKALTETVSNIITEAMNKAGDQINVDALAKKIAE
jgi:hypothetical protein